jgi:hypothetical protein
MLKMQKEVNRMKEYDFGQTLAFISQGKGDLREIFNQQPDKPKPPKRVLKKILRPAELAKKLFCPAFVQAPYSKETLEKRRQFDVLAQAGRIQAIIRMTKKGYRLLEPEKPSGQFNGRVDFVFEDATHQKMKVEAKSSKTLKPWDVVQCILYKEAEDKVAISSIEEFLEPEDWLVDMINAAARDFADFYSESPDIAAKIHLPYFGLCERCSNTECPYKKHN